MSRWGQAGLLAVMLTSLPAAADEAAEAPCAVPAPRSAVATVVEGVIRGLRGAPEGLVVASAPLQSDEEVVEGGKLERLLGEQVAGRLGARFVVGGLEVAKADPEARAVVWLMPVVGRGQLRLAADAHPVRRSVWAKARRPGATVHVHAAAPLDAEVRSYLAPLDFAPEPRVSRYLGADEGVLAMACTDADGDGVPEVFTSSRERVVRWHLGAEGASSVAAFAWSEVPMSPVPWRDPIGFLGLSRGQLVASVSDRRGHVRLGGKLEAEASGEGMAVPWGTMVGCTWRRDLALGDEVRGCQGEGSFALGLRGDALASTVRVDARGQADVVFAIREGHALHLVDGDGAHRFGRVGAQLAVGDLDQDGALETLHSLDVGLPSRDLVEVSTVREGKAKRRYRVAVPTGVDAVAVCPPDRAGAPAAWAVATKAAIWVVR